MGEAEQDKVGNEKPGEKPGTLKGIIITAAFTFLGGLIGVLGKGCYDLAIEKQKSISELTLEDKKTTAELNLEKEKFEENKRLERQKLDAELVKLALEASGSNGAETLGFMVDTNLIEDVGIRKGVTAYLASKKPVPQLQTNAHFSGEDIDTGLVKSPDGKFSAIFVNTGYGEQIHLLDEASQTRHMLNWPEGEAITQVSFSPDSRKLLAVSRSNSV